MNLNDRFNNILNECLDRIIKGETVEDCLKSYPEQAGELEPLLRTAKSARIASTIQPRPEFKSRARAEFQSAVREMQAKKTERKPLISWPRLWQPAWSIAVAAIAVIVLGGGSTLAAASNSMPDSALYSVKIATENVQLSLTPSDIGKAELNAKFADRRVDEIIYTIATNKVDGLQEASNNLSVNMSNLSGLAGVEAPAPAALNSQAAGGGGGESSGFAPDNQSTLTFGTLAVPEPVTSPMPENATEPPVVKAPAPVSDSGVRSTERNEGKSVNSYDTGTTPVSSNPRAVELEKVKEIIINSYIERQARLEAALQGASPEARQVIQNAIDKSAVDFEQSLRNIELVQNSQ
jgi:hypothetical protein